MSETSTNIGLPSASRGAPGPGGAWCQRREDAWYADDARGEAALAPGLGFAGFRWTAGRFAGACAAGAVAVRFGADEAARGASVSVGARVFGAMAEEAAASASGEEAAASASGDGGTASTSGEEAAASASGDGGTASTIDDARRAQPARAQAPR
ncbi:MAG: hypothetical protein MUF34_01075 [Polyangiaceae bacterium]|nr:hypothetical protein [Polyangiaceae bacterium]